MKFIKKVFLSVLIIALVFVLFAFAPKSKIEGGNPWLKSSNNNVALVIAHGGGQLYYPSNTISAFNNSFELGVDVLEMDIHMTSDDILVLRHGENNTGNIRSMSNCDTVIWNETYQYLYDNCNFGYNFTDIDGLQPYRDMTHSEWVDAGVYMTRLEDLFIEFGKDILYVIEIKADADAPRLEAADALYDLIVEYDLIDYVLAATSYHDISSYIMEEYPTLMLSASHDKAQDSIIKIYTGTDIFLKPERYYALQIPISYGFPVIETIQLDTRILINGLHNHNMAVHYWTINDEDEMKRLLELGCDGIITDDPVLLREVIENMK